MAEGSRGATYGIRLDSSQRSIRLLQVLPQSSHSPQDLQSPKSDLVTCRMFEACLDENDSQPRLFNALSYVWGDPNDLTNILVNNEVIPVRSNLENALRHLRDHHERISCDFPLWVDALCINQDDEEERNEQVDMMGDIYRRANRVLAWLGSGDTDTDWLVPLLRSQEFRDEIQNLDRQGSSTPGLDIVRAAAVSMEDLCRRTWWGRLWVSQEIILANQDSILIIGREHVLWSEYIPAFEVLSSIDIRLQRDKEHDAVNKTLYVNTHPGLPFIYNDEGGYYPGLGSEALDRFRTIVQEVGFIPLASLYASGSFLRLSASISHDFVYALRGLLPAQEQELIPVEYSSPPLSVFHNAMVAAWISPFGRRQLADLHARIDFYRDDSGELHNIPSWVPDLSRQEGTRRSPVFISWRSAWRTLNVRLSPDKQMLTLRGLYFDSVLETCDINFEWFEDEYFSDLIVNMADLERAVQVTSAAMNREIQSPDVINPLCGLRNPARGQPELLRLMADLAMLPTSDHDHERLWGALWAKLLKIAAGGVHDTDAAILTLRQCAQEELLQRHVSLTAEECVSEFFSAFQVRLHGNRVFTTAAGFIGVGPGHMSPGDSIVFPFGMVYPFVVRPITSVSHEMHEYRMIGVAEVPELSDHRERLDAALESGLLGEIDINLR